MKKEKILVIEDSKLFANAIDNAFNKDLFELVIVNSLEEATMMFEMYANEYLLSICDITLPDAPNGEVVDLSLKYGISPIVLTSHIQDSFRDKFLNKDIIDYVIKDNREAIEYVAGLCEKLLYHSTVSVLLIDDSPTYLDYMGNILKLLRFKNIYKALSAQEGFALLEEHKEDIRLVLTDYHMAEHDGEAVIKRIRHKYKREVLPIIAVTTKNEPKLASKLIKFGANDFIGKPFDKEEFVSRVVQTLKISHLYNKLNEQKEELQFKQNIVDEQVAMGIIDNNNNLLYISDKFKQFFDISRDDLDFDDLISFISENSTIDIEDLKFNFKRLIKNFTKFSLEFSWSSFEFEATDSKCSGCVTIFVNDITQRVLKEKESWIKEGINILNFELVGSTNINDLCEKTISFMTSYTQASVGSFYLLKGDVLYDAMSINDYAYDLPKFTVDVSSGMIKDVSDMIMTQEEVVSVFTATNEEKKLRLFAYPVVHDEINYGVIMLGFEDEIDEKRYEFMESTIYTLGVHAIALNRKIEMDILHDQVMLAQENLKLEHKELEKEKKNVDDIAEYLNVEVKEKIEHINELNVTVEGVFENIDEAIVVVDNDNMILDRNSKFKDIFKTQACKGKNIKEYLDLGFSDEDKYYLDENIYSMGHIQLNENTSMYVFHDITTDVTFQEQLKLQLDDRTSELEDAKYELEKILDSKLEMFNKLSHDLKTPINAIQNFTKFVIEDLDCIECKEDNIDMLSRVLRNSDHLLELISDILKAAKLESHGFDFNITDVDLSALSSEVVLLNEANAKEKDLTLSFDSNIQNNIIIKSDKKELRDVITNIISNAIKYTNEGGVLVVLFDKGDEVVLEISDSGRGIPSDKIPTLFEPFSQIKESDSKIGHGFGLFIVKKVCDELGVKVEVDSILDKGSQFRLIFKKEI
jgi:signal transduction histidine kinase/CheY-like chemotaxis protein